MAEIELSTAPMAVGRTAEVFEWEPGTILKLYREWCPADWVEKEALVASTISAAGISTPAVKEIVEVKGRRGIIYERVVGVSMLADLKARPWMVLRHARSLAELQSQYFQIRIPALASYHKSLAWSIARVEGLPEDLRALALKMLETLPDGSALCHADFHPGNVLISARGPVIIDWMTGCSGSPWADIARTTLLLTIGPIGAEKKQLSPILKLFLRTFYGAYSQRIKELVPDEQHEQKRWLPVICAARLQERIEPEREALIEAIRSAPQAA